MIRSARSVALLFTRVGAVAFALTACGYLVVTAQRRAHPPPVETPASADPLTTEAAPATADETFLQGSKSLVLEPTEAVAVEGAADVADTEFGTVFSSSSKTLNWTPHPNPAPLAFPPIEPTGAPATTAKSGFLYSSKSGAVAVPSPLVPGTVTEGSLPLPPSPGKTSSSSAIQVAPDGTVTPVEPVFLPSSKVRTGLNPLQPEKLVPGTTTTSKRVFLPSSKSLRIDPVAPKPVPAPAPVDPPKHP